MEFVPSHILDGCIVMQYLEDREYLLVDLFILLDVPDADTLVTES